MPKYFCSFTCFLWVTHIVASTYTAQSDTTKLNLKPKQRFPQNIVHGQLHFLGTNVTFSPFTKVIKLLKIWQPKNHKSLTERRGPV